MPVPNTFANATTSIPLSQLDANFATAITIGNSSVQLGNTVSTLNNMTLANVTINSGEANVTKVIVSKASNTSPSVTFVLDNNTGMYSPGDDIVAFTNGGQESMRIDATRNVRIGTAALATTATDGFLYVPTCAGVPTGTPTSITGLAPIVIDTTNNRLYFYASGAWRNAGP